jgi:hypothetical protein
MVSLSLDEIPDSVPLTPREKKLKAELEAVVAHGLDEFLRVGAALAELRNRRLYRCEAHDFATYVKTKFALARSTADQIIRSSQTAESLLEAGVKLPPGTTEAVIRPIASLPGKDLQAVCWQLAESLAPSRGVTQPLVSRLCRVVRNCLEGVDEDGGNESPLLNGAHHNPKRRGAESPEREAPFVRPILRLSAWSGFSIELVCSHANHLETARTLYLACGVMIQRCSLVQHRLASDFPALIQ